MQVAHVAHVLLAAHRVNHRSGPKEQQSLEEGVCEHVKDARRKCADAQRQEHVAQLRHRGVGQHPLDVVLHQPDRRRKDGGQRPHDGNRLH